MIEEIKEGYVKTEREHGIATIEFYHPQSNSLPGKILEALAKTIHAEGQDPQTKVIILRSAGEKTFCAGASFDELAAISNEAEGLKFFSGFANVINAMRTCGKIIIARVQGKCIGGGVGLAAAADYAIACEAAEVKLSELAVGIGPFVVGPAVERKIGLSAFSQLTIDATMYRPADWARKKGLFAELHKDIAGMDDAITRLSTTLSKSSTEALAEIKKIFWNGTEHWDVLLKEIAAISGRLILSEYSKHFIASFKKNKFLATLSFDDKELIRLCNSLADKDADLKEIIESYGYPPFWKRALHVETLVQIILEQQVSLASAKAAFLQLKKKIGKCTPEKLLALSDEDFRAAYFSKQKTSYTRNLATAIVNGEINLRLLANESDDIIRTKLTKIKGIGNWTADVFLMMVLSRPNLFPFGDVALVNSLKHIKKLPKETSKEEMEWIVEQWAPYKTIAAFMLWWAYIQRKNIKL